MFLAEWARRLWYLLNRRQLERDLRYEMEAHREMMGQPAGFGNTLRLREEASDIWGWAWLENAWRDLRYGARLLRLSPGFTAVALLSLALGIGANTAIFQLLNTLRLSSLPVQDPAELASVKIANRTWHSGSFTGRYSDVTYPLWEQIRGRQQAFSGSFAWGVDTFNLAQGGEIQPAEGIWVSGNFFHVLGVPPLLGRVFTTADDRRGCGSPGVVLSHAFWQRQYGGDQSAIGRTLTLQSHPFEIIGVTPPSFYGVEVGRRFDVALPLCAEPILMGERSRLDTRHAWWLAVMGRLKPGWTATQATAQLRAISTPVLEATIPPFYTPDRVKKYLEFQFEAVPASSGYSDVRDSASLPLLLLLTISGLVLLIACANLANLMLARASARQREIAVRLALGAGRGRLIRQLLAECLLLAVGGAIAGAFLANALSRYLIRFLSSQGEPLYFDLSLDWRFLAFTAGLAILTCALFGLTPALGAARAAPVNAMKADGRGVTPGRGRFGLRRALVVSQVALSCVLLVSALLFVRSLNNLLTLDAGFRQNGVLIARVNLEALDLPLERLHVAGRELIDRARAIPGVRASAGAAMVPVGGGNSYRNVLVADGREAGTGLNMVTPVYFTTLEMPLLAGRDFDDRDLLSAPAVAIVNQQFADRFFSGANPVGSTFRFEPRPGEVPPVFEIVGLVAGAKWSNLREDLQPMAFLPMLHPEDRGESFNLLIRADTSLEGLLPAARSAIASVSPQISVRFAALDSQIDESLKRERLMATLTGYFGCLAVLLAMIGLYGVMSYLVARRRNEIGIRIALGAGRREVVAMVLKEAGLLAGAGLAIGIVLALAAARAARGLLFGLEPHDPPSLVLAAAVLGAVALIASSLPARQAASLNPTTALREG